MTTCSSAVFNEALILTFDLWNVSSAGHTCQCCPGEHLYEIWTLITSAKVYVFIDIS